MSNSKELTIEIYFASQTDATKLVRGIVEKIGVTTSLKQASELHYLFIKSLFKRHHDQSTRNLLDTLEDIEIAIDENGHKAFLLVNNGKTKRISWSKCIQNLTRV
jgi:hypothetical protein